MNSVGAWIWYKIDMILQGWNITDISELLSFRAKVADALCLIDFKTWNIATKPNEEPYEIQIQVVDITNLIETKKKRQGSESMGYYDHFYGSERKEMGAKQGISILTRKGYRKYITTWEAS